MIVFNVVVQRYLPEGTIRCKQSVPAPSRRCPPLMRALTNAALPDCGHKAKPNGVFMGRTTKSTLLLIYGASPVDQERIFAWKIIGLRTRRPIIRFRNNAQLIPEKHNKTVLKLGDLQAAVLVKPDVTPRRRIPSASRPINYTCEAPFVAAGTGDPMGQRRLASLARSRCRHYLRQRHQRHGFLLTGPINQKPHRLQLLATSLAPGLSDQSDAHSGRHPIVPKCPGYRSSEPTMQPDKAKAMCARGML
ncbi:hypothetical protein BaRGS_00013697, partial [Batillaria attramentaria]